MQVQLKQIARLLAVALLGAGCGCLAALAPLLRQPPAALMIAFIPRTTGTNFTEDMHRGADAAARAAGYQLYWNGPTREDDLDRQIMIADNAVHRGAKALILGPTNIWGLTTIVNALTAKRLPVVFVQTEPAGPMGPYLTSVTPNQEEFGRLAAARVEAATHGVVQVAIVGVGRGTPETLARADSFIRAISVCPRIQIVAEMPGAVQTMEAEQSARELVNTYPKLRAIFAVSADATQGVMLALQERSSHRRISLIGSDRDLFLAANLQDGKLDSLVTANGYQIGFLAVQRALAGIRGQPLPPPTQVDAKLLTRETLVLNDNH